MLIKLGGVLTVLAVIFWLWCLWEAIMAPEDKVRNLPKLAWVFIVLLLLDLGAVLWLVLGRPRANRGGSGGPAIKRGGGGPGPIAPDDDPDFLRRLNDEMRRKQPPKPKDEPSAE